jgi:ParB family chromosome partitioning protein
MARSEVVHVMEKRRLGRGLDALFGAGENGTEAGPPAQQLQVAVDQIQHNPYQPRKAFDEDELSRLRDSVRTHGILQPLVVRLVGDQYQLVAGERRLRAAQAAGLSAVPVRVVDFNDQQTLEAALIENIHRADLNPIEKAQGFQEYLDRFRMSHEQLAERLGLARPTITNLVGLLDLTPEVQDAVRLNQISLGHAKILKGVKNPDRQKGLCKQIIGQGLSVHATELVAREQKPETKPTAPPAPAEEKTSHVKSIEDELRQRFATRVEIRLRGKDRGQIVLDFESNDDFMRLLDALRR